MTEHEISILLWGISIGVAYMLVIHMAAVLVHQAVDNRRDRKAIERARQLLAQDAEADA
ncbi:hypothetical protein ACIP9H_29460 [Streptomyces sp. NPDC088732]|uniref:hypothetical protein n=1 Tax=Streptomyces sp. NPDC088732 TaxID=3365879 RepID=UPI00381FEE9A